jgi:cytoskeletal protein CcmA (bactofilin family)
MISLMVSGLFSAFWLMQSHQQQFLSKVLGEERAIANMVSGLNLFCIAENKDTDLWQTNLFESPIDSAMLRLEPWGLYQLAICQGKRGHYVAQKAALLGQTPGGYFSKSLFLADHRQPLCLSGDTYLGGALCLPGGTYKTATVLGKGFTEKSLPAGPVYSSFLKKVKTYPPALHLLKRNISDAALEVEKTYSLRDWKIRYPWERQAFPQIVDGNLRVEGCEASGKCILAASQTVIIEADAKLDMVLVFGKNIHIKSGFKGRFQAFASESIQLDSAVELDYPSVLMLLPTGKEEVKIEVGKNSRIAGGIGVEKGQQDADSFVRISEGALITGHVWGMEKLELKGEVKGSVSTQHFLLQTAGGQFHNYLVDARIDVRELPRDFAMVMLQEEADLRRVCWLGEEENDD